MGSLRKVLEEVLARAVYRRLDGLKVDTGVVRELWESRRFGNSHGWNGEVDIDGTASFPEWLSIDDFDVERRWLDRLGAELEPLLQPFVQPSSGRVGNGLFLFRGGQGRMRHITVEAFGKVIAIGAARIGVDSTVELLSGWFEGGPFRIRHCAVLEGVGIDAALDRAPGITMSRMPARYEEFPVSLPNYTYLSYKKLRNRTLLSVDVEVRPALYRPDQDETSSRTWERHKHAGANSCLRDFDMTRFCDTLALAIDNHVSALAEWHDLGELEAFMPGCSGSLRLNGESRSRPVAIAQAHLDEAVELYGKRARFAQADIAVSRWVKSKRQAVLEDRLIDLRIALEAAYARGARGKLKLRTASAGAWHCGRTRSERCEIFEVLKTVYGKASDVIHGAVLENEAEVDKYIGLAQENCRKSLLRVIREGEFPKCPEVMEQHCRS